MPVRWLAAIVDFLVDDACHVCGRLHRRNISPPPLDPVRAALTAPVRVGPVHNHPVCPDCAGGLIAAGGDAPIGWFIPGGAVLTRSRELVTGWAGLPAPAMPPGPIPLKSALRTNAALLALIHRLKFSGVSSLAEGLGRGLAVAARPARGLEDPVLVPVPMDPGSRRRRGFNQAELLARVLAREWQVPVAAEAVVKPAPTSPQSLARASERLNNVRSAYRPGPAAVLGRDVVVVDDLVTTGATAAAMAAVLAAAGAASVQVASVGRAL